MQTIQNKTLHKTLLASAMATAIGTMGVSLNANADTYVWGATTGGSYSTECTNSPDAATVTFTMLDGNGATLANSSITTKGANQYQTPTCGTLTYDTSAGTGSATIVPFDFYAGTSPATATGINLEKITGGSGNLILGNMLFDWNGNNGIPVSLVWDGTGILGEMDGTPTSFTLNANGSIASASAFSNTGATPGSDGTYINATWGYLGLGPQPMASTEWNISRAPACATGAGNCLGISPSGVVPIVSDTAANNNKYGQDDGFPAANQGIGGVPMWDGPFTGFNANFEFNNLKLVSFTDTTPPVVTLTGSNSVSYSEGATYVEPGYTCVDAKPLPQTPLTVTVGGSTIPDPLTVAGSPYTVTYDCQDASGNNAVQKTRTITVTPADAPVVTLTGSSTVSQECGITYSDAGASCTDPNDGSIAQGGSGTTASTFNITSGTINVSTTSTGNIVTWSCTDSGTGNNPSGVPKTSTLNRTVNVVDTTAPAITINTPSVGTINGSGTLILQTTDQASYANPTATATDGCDPSVVASTTSSPNWTITSGNQVNSVLVYTSTDSNSNTQTYNLNVEVHRSEPVITLVGNQSTSLAVGATYTEQGMNIHDEQQADLNGVTASGSSSNFTYTITGSVDTSTSGSYTITYNATDKDGNAAATVTRTVIVGVFAPHSNFTMLDPKGAVFGGTNDVVFDWPDSAAVLGGDSSTLNTDQADYTNDLKFNMTISSAGPQPFFGAPWFAHDVRVFGPGTYYFETDNTKCESKAASPDTTANGSKKTTHASAADIRVTGCPGTPGGATTMKMVVGTGQLGVHMLFDYNGSFDIDVVNVWDINGVWNDPDGSASQVNNLWLGAAIDDPSGNPPDPAAPWKLVSRDVNGDGVNGSPMQDGPFVGFYANFNAGGTTGALTCTAPAVLDTTTNTCVLHETAKTTTLKNNFLGATSWLTLLSMLPVFGLLRRRKS